MDNNLFYTPSGYRNNRREGLTESMEDYLEMIFRINTDEGFVRVGVLAKRLNVKPSSASKMLLNLKNRGYVDFEPYGLVMPTEKGLEVGGFLLRRHRILEKFFRFLNDSGDELKLVEQIEHYIDEKTLKNLEKLIYKLERK